MPHYSEYHVAENSSFNGIQACNFIL